MKIEIRNRFSGEIIIEGEYNSIRGAAEDANLSGVDLRDADLRDADLRGVDLRDADLSGVDLRDADLSGVDLRDANLRSANLRNTNLLDANLRSANLRNTNLRGVDLRDADLSGVDLLDADLRSADLRNTNLDYVYIQIQGTSHNFIGFGDNIQIGCYIYSTEYWKIMYDVIGRENNYTKAQIKEYYKYIKMYDEIKCIS